MCNKIWQWITNIPLWSVAVVFAVAIEPEVDPHTENVAAAVANGALRIGDRYLGKITEYISLIISSLTTWSFVRNRRFAGKLEYDAS